MAAPMRWSFNLLQTQTIIPGAQLRDVLRDRYISFLRMIVNFFFCWLIRPAEAFGFAGVTQKRAPAGHPASGADGPPFPGLELVSGTFCSNISAARRCFAWR